MSSFSSRTLLACVIAVAVVGAVAWSLASSDAETAAAPAAEASVPAPAAFPDSLTAPGRRVVLVLDRGDLYCASCLDDVLTLTDSLHARALAPGAVAVILHGGGGGSLGAPRPMRPARLRRWAGQIGLRLPVRPDDGGLFEALGLEQSAVYVLDGDRLLAQAALPAGPRRRADVLALMP